jgi:hypothetical protein
MLLLRCHRLILFFRVAAALMSARRRSWSWRCAWLEACLMQHWTPCSQ